MDQVFDLQAESVHSHGVSAVSTRSRADVVVFHLRPSQARPRASGVHGIRLGNAYLELENIDQQQFLAEIERCYRYPDDAQQFYGCHLMNKKRKPIKHIGIIIL